MGGGHYEDKNGGSGGYNVDADRATKAISGGVDVAPGKRSRTQDVAPNGGAVVNQGLACDGKSGQVGCGLSALQRERLLMDIQLRITDAKAVFLDAATNVRVDKLLEKDSDVPWFLAMMLDIATAFAATKVIEALKALKGGLVTSSVVEEVWGQGPEVISEALKASERKTIKERIHGIDDAAIVQATQTGMAKGKALVTAVLQKAANAPAEEKTAALDYIAELKSKASIAFDAARRSMPAGLNDEQLCALDESWQPGYHSPEGYLQAITAQVNLFKASGISKIGRSLTERVPTDEDGQPISGGPFANTAVRRDVRVAWYSYVSGYPKQLVFQHQDAERDVTGYRMDDPGMSEAPGTEKGARHYKFGPPGGEIDEKPMSGVDNLPGTPFYIDPSLWEVALEKHRATWGVEPEHFTVDESNWSWDPTRAKAARAQKEMQAVKNLPRLQLGAPPKPATVPQNKAIQEPYKPAGKLPPVGTLHVRH